LDIRQHAIDRLLAWTFELFLGFHLRFGASGKITFYRDQVIRWLNPNNKEDTHNHELAQARQSLVELLLRGRPAASVLDRHGKPPPGRSCRTKLGRKPANGISTR
jgi:hypothetical protein